MPNILKAVYIGAAAIAVGASMLGFYEYVIVGRESATFGGDVFLPMAILGIIVALYMRRKREFQDRRPRSKKAEDS